MSLYKHTSNEFEAGQYFNSKMLEFPKTDYENLNKFISSSKEYKYMLLSMMINHKSKRITDIVSLFKLLKSKTLAFPQKVWDNFKVNGTPNTTTLMEYVHFLSTYNTIKEQ